VNYSAVVEVYPSRPRYFGLRGPIPNRLSLSVKFVACQSVKHGNAWPMDMHPAEVENMSRGTAVCRCIVRKDYFPADRPVRLAPTGGFIVRFNDQFGEMTHLLRRLVCRPQNTLQVFRYTAHTRFACCRLRW